jgi:hypothetical protein
MVTAIYVPADEGLTAEVKELDGSLESYQREVGGWIEYLTVGDISFILNEEGKVYGLPINPYATAYLYTVAPEFVGHDVLCGNVLIVGNDEDEGETTNVPQQVIKDFSL